MAVAVVSADVSRLTAELWRAGDVIPATKGSAPGAGYAIHGLVSARGALAVLPLEQPVAAAAAMVRWTDATTWGDAGRRAAAWVGLRTGLAAPLVRRRVALRVTGGDGPEPALNEYMAAAVGVPQATVSVAFGSPRPNQKPIVRIHDTGGATLGYAKVAWNPLTTALVDTETAFLASAASRTLRRIRIAKVLHTGTWGGRNIAVVAPLSGSPGLRRTTPPGPAVLEELAALGDVHHASIAASSYRTALPERIKTLPPRAAAAAHEALAAIDARWAATDLRWGRWHGDWVPWNMRTSGDEVVVWDWERTADGVPVGFDALHYRFHQALAGTKESSITALLGAAAATTPTLNALGVAEDAVPAITALYALEMHLRFGAEDTARGRGVAWLNGLLPAATDRLGG